MINTFNLISSFDPLLNFLEKLVKTANVAYLTSAVVLLLTFLIKRNRQKRSSNAAKCHSVFPYSDICCITSGTEIEEKVKKWMKRAKRM